MSQVNPQLAKPILNLSPQEQEAVRLARIKAYGWQGHDPDDATDADIALVLKYQYASETERTAAIAAARTGTTPAASAPRPAATPEKPATPRVPNAPLSALAPRVTDPAKLERDKAAAERSARGAAGAVSGAIADTSDFVGDLLTDPGRAISDRVEAGRTAQEADAARAEAARRERAAGAEAGDDADAPAEGANGFEKFLNGIKKYFKDMGKGGAGGLIGGLLGVGGAWMISSMFGAGPIKWVLLLLLAPFAFMLGQKAGSNFGKPSAPGTGTAAEREAGRGRVRTRGDDAAARDTGTGLDPATARDSDYFQAPESRGADLNMSDTSYRGRAYRTSTVTAGATMARQSDADMAEFARVHGEIIRDARTGSRYAVAAADPAAAATPAPVYGPGGEARGNCETDPSLCFY